MNNESKDFERWLLEKIFRYSFGLPIPADKIVDADAPDEHPNDTKLIQGAVESNDDEETFFCSVCNMPAFTYCSACDDAICEICGVEDENIIFCYECRPAPAIQHRSASV